MQYPLAELFQLLMHGKTQLESLKLYVDDDAPP